MSEVERGDPVCYLNGLLLPLSEAKVGILTHAFLYGTAVFEGIRGYWDPERKRLAILRLPEHLARLAGSARILRFEGIPDPDELTRIVLEVCAANGFREDVYIRPSFYKATEAIGVGLDDLAWGLYVVALPFGDYLPRDGIRAVVSSWRRVSDNAIPARAKITGAYANSALARSEAAAAGAQEAIVLTEDGHVSEGSAENIFLVRGGRLITPPVTDDILEGITRAGVIELAGARGLEVVERRVDRSEIYLAEEVFLCGTGAQLVPVIAIDGRAVGAGRVGPVAEALRGAYEDAVRGADPAFAHWLTPVGAGV